MALARWQRTITDQRGNILPGAQVTVRHETAGAPLVSLFSDRAGLVPQANPTFADADGFASFHAAGGAFRLDIQSGSETQTLRYLPVGLAQELDAVVSGIAYNFSDEVTDADPGSGFMRFNDADYSAVTQLYVSDENASAIDVSGWLSTISDGTLTINDATGAGLLQVSITGAAVDATTYWKIPVSVTTSSADGSFVDGVSVGIATAGDGADGTNGLDGVSGGIAFTFDDSVDTASDPGTANVRFNNATLASVTEIAVDDQSAETGNPDISAWIASFNGSTNVNKGQITIKNTAAQQNFIIFDVTAVTDATTHNRITVSHVDSAGSFSDTDGISLSFSASGDAGLDGTDGIDGTGSGMEMTFDVSTDTASDPGTGDVRFNNAAFSLVTEIAVDDQSAAASNPDISAWVTSWATSTNAVKGHVTFRKFGAPENFAIYDVTAVTDATTHNRVTVVHVNSFGSFSDTDELIMDFAVAGDIGAAGDDGTTAGIDFDFDVSTTTTADPGTGDFRLNNADLSLVTEIAVSYFSGKTGNPDVSAWIATWDDSTSPVRGQLVIRKNSAPENFANYNVTAISDQTTFYRVTVTHVASSGSFSDTDSSDLMFTRTGDQGGGTGDAWSDPVDATITPDGDNTRDLATDANRFATMFSHKLNLSFSATGPSQRAIDGVVAGNGEEIAGVSGVFFDMGALATDQDQSGHFLIVDRSSTTGGMFAGFGVNATEGAADIYSLFANAGVNPVQQFSGAFATPDVWDNNGVDETTEIGTAGSPYSSVFVADNDYVIVGDANQFFNVAIVLQTAASGAGITATFEYSTGGTSFATTATVIDATGDFTQSGNIIWEAGDVPGWVPNASGDYEFRITRTRNTLATTPVVDTASVANTIEYLWTEDGDLDVRAIRLREQAAAPADQAGKGQFWVRNDSPNIPMFTQDDGTDLELVYAGGIFHDSFADFVENEHVNHASVSINSGNGLTGGGDITATRTLTVGGGTGITVNTSDVAVSENVRTAGILAIFDGGGSAITTGEKGELRVPFNCTIVGATVLADQTGSIQIDIWKDTFANYPPTVADTITASAKPTISSSNKSEDVTLTGWTTAVSEGDILKFNIDSATTIQRATLLLEVVKT